MRGPTRQQERAVGLAVLALVAVLAWAVWGAESGGPFATDRSAELLLPERGPVLRPGSEVRLGGRRVGEVREVRAPRRARDRAVVRLTIGDTVLGRDARARVRLRGMAGSTYVELTPGDPSDPLPDGGRLPAASTTTSVQLPDVIAAFDADARRALGRTLSVAGTGLSGRGTQINRTLGDLPEAVAGVARPLAALDRGGDVGGALTAARGVGDALPADDLAGLLPAGAATAAAVGRRAAALRATLRAVPALEDRAARTLPAVDRLLAEAEPAARELGPAVADLVAGLPELHRLERRAPRLRAVDDLARTAAPVLADATPHVRRLRAPVRSLPAALGPLATFSATLAPYREELREAPLGFTRWGGFRYDFGQAPGARAVRFSMVLTCTPARDPYPEPGEAGTHRTPCDR